jgi:prefoldin subunit 5
MASSSDSQQQQPPNFNALLQYLQSQTETTDSETAALATDVQKLDVSEETTEQDKVNAYVAEFLYIGGPEVLAGKKSDKQK